MRVYHYYGPSPRRDGGAFLIHQAMVRIPTVKAFLFECHGDPKMHGKSDLNIAVDWAEDALMCGDFIEPRPLVYWMSDTHCNAEAKAFRYAKAKRADVVYCSIWSDVEGLRAEGIKATWMPYAAEPLAFHPHPDIKVEHDVGFVGHVGDYGARTDFLDAMFKAYPDFLLEWSKYLEDCSMEMAKCRVVLNHCWSNAINMRVMEGMSNGNLVLTPQTEDLAMLGIQDGVHVATYRNTAEAIEKARAYLHDAEGRERIGQAGRELVLAKHTYVHRALQMLRDAGHSVECEVNTIINTMPPPPDGMGPQEPRINPAIAV